MRFSNEISVDAQADELFACVSNPSRWSGACPGRASRAATAMTGAAR
jgi:carbon monoxide dehydrogenase subunit G